jgi:two-component system, response regulator PdtaR
MSRPLRIAAADDERSMREYLRDLLPRLGHQVVLAEGGRQLIELCRVSAPDLVITDIKLGDMDGLDAAAEINRERAVPVVIISAHHDPEMRARVRGEHIMGYLVKPVKQADLETAIDMAVMRFEHCQTLRREAAELRQSLEDRKIIERAKGVVMRRTGANEEESFRRLRKLSSNQNRKLIDVARSVMAAEEVFAELEKDASLGGRPGHEGHNNRFVPRRPFRPAGDGPESPNAGGQPAPPSAS